MKLAKEELAKLLEALQELDVKAAPHGLYAIREHQAKEGELHPEFKMEWEQALTPVLKNLKCNPPKFIQSLRFQNVFCFQDTTPLSALTLVRLSKIKVRRYGNAYRVDPHHDFSELGTAPEWRLYWQRQWNGRGGWWYSSGSLMKMGHLPGSSLLWKIRRHFE